MTLKSKLTFSEIDFDAKRFEEDRLQICVEGETSLNPSYDRSHVLGLQRRLVEWTYAQIILNDSRKSTPETLV